jgi:hypothetical protein
LSGPVWPKAWKNIVEKTGCDLRRLSDVIDLLIAIIEAIGVRPHRA